MIQIYWFGKKNHYAGSVWTSDENVAFDLYEAMRKSKWKSFVLMHTASSDKRILYGEADYEEWKKEL